MAGRINASWKEKQSVAYSGLRQIWPTDWGGGGYTGESGYKGKWCILLKDMFPKQRSTRHTAPPASVVVETSHICWNNETIRFKSSLTSIIIESTYLTLNMNTIWGCFKVQVGWKKCILWGNWVSKRSRRDPDH